MYTIGLKLSKCVSCNFNLTNELGKYLQVLLSSSQHINKGPEYAMLKPWLNKGLLTSGSNKNKTKPNDEHYCVPKSWLTNIFFLIKIINGKREENC